MMTYTKCTPDSSRHITMDKTFGCYCHKETCEDNKSWSKSMIQVNAFALSQPESSTFGGS